MFSNINVSLIFPLYSSGSQRTVSRLLIYIKCHKNLRIESSEVLVEVA